VNGIGNRGVYNEKCVRWYVETIWIGEIMGCYRDLGNALVLLNEMVLGVGLDANSSGDLMI
jgi:hypothetical protein